MAGIALVLCDAKAHILAHPQVLWAHIKRATRQLLSWTTNIVFNKLLTGLKWMVVEDCEHWNSLIYTHTFVIQKPVCRDCEWLEMRKKTNVSNFFQFPLKDNYEFWVLSFSYSIFISLSGFGMEKVVSSFLKVVAKVSLRHEFYSQP